MSVENFSNELERDNSQENSENNTEMYDPDDRVDDSIETSPDIDVYDPDDSVSVNDIDSMASDDFDMSELDSICESISDELNGENDSNVDNDIVDTIDEVNPSLSVEDLENVDGDDANEIGIVEEQQSSEELNNSEISQDDAKDGDVKYTDDDGKVYRINDNVLPNTEFKVNEYTYKTDDQGRTISASGELQPKKHSGRLSMRDKMDVVGKGDQLKSDDRGHLIADQFNGRSLANLVPMDSGLNKGAYANLENNLAKARDAGSAVYVQVEPVYSANSRRPSEFRFSYTVDGEKSVQVFKNGDGMK